MKRNLIYCLLCAIFPMMVIGQDFGVFVVDKDYLRKHDIVYLDPDYDGYNGFPLGNGDIGGMIWTSENGIMLQINKINLYDRPADAIATLKAAARVSIDFGVPANNYLYLTDFQNRLSLLDATNTLHSETAFIDNKVRAWVNANSNVWVIECETNYKDNYASEIEVVLERWGSRHFGDWYNSWEKDASLGLARTQSSIRANDILLNDTLEGGLRFTVACRMLGDKSIPLVQNKNRGLLKKQIQSNHKFQVLVSVVTSDDADNTEVEALALLNNAEKQGLDNVYAQHINKWHNFWAQSFVHLENDYLENIYYLRRYLAGSSSRGEYPVPFNGGLWVWNHDHRQWITSVHWNTQQSCWGLAEQNDPELMKPYIKTYFRAMPKAEEFTKERHGVNNAIRWTEVHDFDGKMLHADRGDMKYNYTPASQMAGIFWNYYEFTGNRACLQDTIYPFMKEAAELYLNLLEWDKEKGQYYIYPAQPYEHPYTSDLKNPITDRYMIESLFRNCIEASKVLNVDSRKRKQWEKVINHLWEPPILDVPGKGKVFVMAYRPDGEIYPNLETYPKRQFYHCDAHTTMVFPANLLGLDQKGTEYFDIAKNVALHHPEDRNAITPGAIVSARLGLGNKALERVENMISYLQHFNQGLFYNIDHWHVLSVHDKEIENNALRAQRDYVFDKRCHYGSYAGNSGLWAQPFVQCGMEPINILSAAVNEMLLQSHEGKIRVFPARPDNQAMAFSLRARGAFLVSASADKEGNIPAIAITSLNGNDCIVQNPWTEKEIRVTDVNGQVVSFQAKTDGTIAFKTKKNGQYRLFPANATGIEKEIFAGEQNNTPKFFREATLGTPRTFTKN